MITLTREEAQQVLDELLHLSDGLDAQKAIELLRAKLSEPESTTHLQFRGKMHVVCKCDKCIAQPEPEPVAWIFQHEDTGQTDCIDNQQVEWGFEKNNPRWQKIAPLYTTPPQRKECQRCGEVNPAEIHTCTPQREWVGLTDEEISNLWCKVSNTDFVTVDTHAFSRAIEAKLKEKNAPYL